MYNDKDILPVEDSTTPGLGGGATLQIGSDFYAYTVTKVSKTGHMIEIQQDYVTRDQDGNQVFLRDINGEVKRVYRGKSGHYTNGPYRVYFGKRRFDMDPCF